MWGNVPPRNKNFTGRADILERLHGGASSNVTAVLPGEPLPKALQGLGGVGKTAVAIEYAHRYRSEYEVIWWIPADQSALIPSSLAALAEHLGLPPTTATGIETASSSVLDALRRGEPYSRWLLIFDNADEPEALNKVIPTGPGDVLITSRNHSWHGVVDTVGLDVFARQESREFLIKRVPDGLTEPEADQLADRLGDLPLALEQAGALQAETAMSVDEYIQLLEKQVTRVMGEGRPPGYPEPMTAAWQLSVSELERHVPQAKALLRCCAFLGPEPIPHDLFRRAIQVTEARVSDLMADPLLLSQAIRALGRFALVKIEGRTISVHRLVQALLRDELDADEQAKYRHDVHLILAAAAPRSPDDRRLWGRYEELLAHVTSAATQLPSCQDENVRAFALDVVRYLYQSGNFASCRSFCQRLIDQWTEDSGSGHPTVLDAQRHLGNSLRLLGLYPNAYTVIEETLNKSEDVLGVENPLTLALRNSFGADLRARGAFAKALSLDQDTLSLHRTVFGPGHPQTYRVMNNLAADYALNSRYAPARELHQRVYRLQSEAAEAVSATEFLTSWNNLARVLRLSGDYAIARDFGQDALEYGRTELAPEHYLTLRTANDLSIALRRVGASYDEALEVAAEVYRLCLKLFTERSPDTMAAAISLTNIQRTMGRTTEALQLAERTVTSYPDVYGPEHPYNYGCASNLALLSRVTGDATAARDLNEKALAGLHATLGENHHYSLTVATNLASDLAALGNSAQARALGETTLARVREALGESHPLTLGCAANLSLDLRAEQLDDEADRLLAATMSQYEATLGANHPDVKVAMTGGRLDFDFDPMPI